MNTQQLTEILKRDVSVSEEYALRQWASHGQVAKRWACFVAGLLVGALIAWIL